MSASLPTPTSEERVAVVGLGYVGLPLAIALAAHARVVGYDLDRRRIAELRDGHDRTGSFGPAALRASRLVIADDPAAMAESEIFIVTAPTPVDRANEPDLTALLGACDTVGRAMRAGALVVFESTVYPGVTEEVCRPVLERVSGLRHGAGFRLGYSPERVNVGDPAHGLGDILKVVAGDTPEVAARLERLYGKVARGVFVARDIRTAEAAKVIENAQRDINIAFVNEVTMIFARLGLSVHDVLETAGTKWNFHPYRPGLVGGHCIGVDPFYLAHAARAAGHEPEIILAGRRINDGMGDWLAGEIRARLAGALPEVLVLGLTFKENVPDLRNSKVADLVAGLARRGCQVRVHDPLGDREEAWAAYRIALERELPTEPGDAVVLAVAHDAYRRLGAAELARLVRPGGVLCDLKAALDRTQVPEGVGYWRP